MLLWLRCLVSRVLHFLNYQMIAYFERIITIT